LAIDAIHPLSVDLPTFAPKKNMKAAIAVSRSLRRQLEQTRLHRLVGLSAKTLAAIRRTAEARQSTRGALAEPVLVPEVANRRAPGRGRHHFLDSASFSACSRSVRSATAVLSRRFST